MTEFMVLGLFVLLPCLGLVAMWLFFGKYKLHRREKRGVALLVLGNAIVLWTLLTAVLPLGEADWRWLYDTTDAYAFTRTSRRWLKRHYHVNKYGFRNDVAEKKEKTGSRRRLVILGDSFTAGHGIANFEDTYGAILRQKMPDWEVCFHAMLGWESVHELIHVQKMVDVGYQCDAVLLAYCLNDISKVVPEWTAISTALYESKPGVFVEHSFLINLVYFRMYWLTHPEVNSYFGFLAQAYSGPPWNSEQQILEKMHEIVRERLKARLLVVTFPFFHCLGPEYPFSTAHEKLDTFWKEQDVPHLDLLDTFRDLPPAELTVNRLDPYPNERAHALIAEKLLPFLEENCK
jgi:hypothetical protein